MAAQQFRLPDLGEGLTEGEILRWLVEVGDAVRVNQPIVEVETAKAAVEVPSPLAGVVTDILAPPGMVVPVGAALVTIDVEASEAPGPAGTSERRADAGEAAAAAASAASAASASRPSVLVGYGPPTVPSRRRARRQPAGPPPVDAGVRAVQPLAPPPVRKLARDLGVRLETVRGSGPGGVISREDVTRAAQPAPAHAVQPERLPVRGLQRAMATAMSTSAFTAPHASLSLAVDVTASVRLRERLAVLPDFAELPVSPLLLVARALAVAVPRHPLINSSWDQAAQEIVIHPAVNLGIAVASTRGLVVPNVKDAGALPLAGLARVLRDLTVAAREGRTTPTEMVGGTITLTNVGVFGVDGGAPILNPGEAAILAMGQVRQMPWVVDGALAVRDVVQLTVAFDHRIVDGRLAGEFLADVGALLTEPALLTVWG
ncbi:MAG: dihydrolipoamide acetyltransferase family protein [Frankiaceae bacterium]